MITTKVYEGQDMKIGCQLALDFRLYVTGWQMYGEFVHLKTYWMNGQVALTFKDNTPVAAVVWNGYKLQAFCRASERRKGYASMAVKALNIPQASAEPGIHGSENFWRNNGVTCNGNGHTYEPN